MPATILAFDTSAAHCAAVILHGEDITALGVLTISTGQAEVLLPLLDRMLAAAGTTFSRVDAVACGTGPGNFTGVRISVAAARGLALALGRPAIGVTGFEALAHGLTRPCRVALPAQRGMIHRQTFTGTGNLPPETVPGSVPQPDPGTFVTSIARVASLRLGATQPRPVPVYLRGPDAAPPRDPTPAILP